MFALEFENFVHVEVSWLKLNSICIWDMFSHFVELAHRRWFLSMFYRIVMSWLQIYFWVRHIVFTLRLLFFSRIKTIIEGSFRKNLRLFNRDTPRVDWGLFLFVCGETALRRLWNSIDSRLWDCAEVFLIWIMVRLPKSKRLDWTAWSSSRCNLFA